MSVKNLYTEKLKKMSEDELLNEIEKHGKIMERKEPMTKDEKARALMCFRYAMNLPDIGNENRLMLATAIRVLRIL
jgi:hypothetical protein